MKTDIYIYFFFWSSTDQNILEWKLFQTNFVEKIKQNVYSITFYGKSCHLCGNVENNVERRKPHIKIWRMRIACRIPSTIYTHSGCAILIAFPLQQWLHGRALILLPVLFLISAVKTLLQFTEASIHTIHCHTAIGGQIVCRLILALVNKPDVQFVHIVFWFKNRKGLFSILCH